MAPCYFESHNLEVNKRSLGEKNDKTTFFRQNFKSQEIKKTLDDSIAYIDFQIEPIGIFCFLWFGMNHICNWHQGGTEGSFECPKSWSALFIKKFTESFHNFSTYPTPQDTTSINRLLYDRKLLLAKRKSTWPQSTYKRFHRRCGSEQ